MSRPSEYEFYSSCPFRTARVQLARWVEGDEPESRRLARYESEICWLRESGTVAAFYWDDKAFKEIETTNDYYGFLTSPEFEKYAEIVDRLKITPSDRLQVAAYTIVEDIPCYVVEQKEGFKTKFCTPTKSIFIGDDELFDRIEKFDYNKPPSGEGDWCPHHSFLKTTQIAKHLTWSSHSDRNQEADLNALREAYLRGGTK